MNMDDIEADLAAFADDDDDFELDEAGVLIMRRGGRDILAQIQIGPDGVAQVEMADKTMSYRSFLMRELGQLDVLATRLIDKRPGVNAFVNAAARTESASYLTPSDSDALGALGTQCTGGLGFQSRVCFLTADAGHGKTALLREHQANTAAAFLAGKSPYLFWHIDLQGRQLLRLAEALMGDLAELRVAGLWMPAIIRLIQYRALVLAIDGFDELAAEQGGSDALGALATLVQQMSGRGVIVAASRRTFFDTGDYVRRSARVGKVVAEPCEFNQITLLDWNRAEAIEYLSKIEVEGSSFPDAERTLSEIVHALGGSTAHPLVTKPFLLSQIARGLLTYDVTPTDFIRPLTELQSGVANVVEAFVKREVTSKWVSRETGEPYLTEEQHISLLGDVASEMHLAGKDRLPLDLIDTVAALRLDEWGIPQDKQRQVMEMVRMHALLRPPDGSAQYRMFDHPEFRDYFLAVSLRNHLASMEDGNTGAATAQLSIAMLSDSVARYVRGTLPAGANVSAIASHLASACDQQIRSTFLPTNAGTFIPTLLSDRSGDEAVNVKGRVVFSSLVFEETKLRNIRFEGALLVNVSLRGVDWASLSFDRCSMGELRIYETTRVDAVSLVDCEVDAVIRHVGGSVVETAYAPSRIRQLLRQSGFDLAGSEPADNPTLPDSAEVTAARRFFQCFSRSSTVTTEIIERRFKGEGEAKWVAGQLIPLLEHHGVLEEKQWRGKGSKTLWGIRQPVAMVLAGEDDVSGPMAALWNALRAMHF